MRTNHEAPIRSCIDAGGPFSVERSFGETWCGGCGYRVGDHQRIRIETVIDQVLAQHPEALKRITK